MGSARHARPSYVPLGPLLAGGLTVAAVSAVLVTAVAVVTTMDPSAGTAATTATERTAGPAPALSPRAPTLMDDAGPSRPPAAELIRKGAAPRALAHGVCEASYYDGRHGTASGEPYDGGALTAAHRTLPLHSLVRVTNQANGRSVVVRINDRGPFVPGRCLDLSAAAMRAVGGTGAGVIPVRYTVLQRN